MEKATIPIKQVLIQRLEKKGVGLSIIPRFIKDLANLDVFDPYMNFLQANKRLRYLGWDGIDLDYHTFQLVIAYFEVEGLQR